MLGIYFSGTGNSKYCTEVFLHKCGFDAPAVSIEQPDIICKLKDHQELVIGFPVQYSNLPKILRDFVVDNRELWHGKRIFIIATMGLFSGDGTGTLARLLRKYGAVITGGLHLKMPDSICDEPMLKRPLSKNQQLVKEAELKIEQAANAFTKGRPPQEGLGALSFLMGLFGQRLYFYHKTQSYSDKLKIDAEKCIGCGKCVQLCPMKNISLDAEENHAKPGNQCTMCYRCANRCPTQAITLLGKKVIEQCYVEKYLTK
ncbi:MAG: EFR1 family ferrodoxin [Oscillospiraceae bacterium]|nr:EFR1 family ferrodoxin [Oscillospiraceae bacterium]MDE7171025.1 EFR1 family ferrodoxin [Oscillospiraceae bacterium]